MRRIVLTAALVLGTAGNALAYSWVDGRSQRCDLACESQKLKAVSSGNYSRNGEKYFICSFSGRPGYNLAPNWNTICTVGKGGKEVSSPTYKCLCN